MSKPYRLNSGGRIVDRSRKVQFSFDGKTLTASPGIRDDLRAAGFDPQPTRATP